MTWREGDTVVHRNIWFGRVRNATPMRVVTDDGERVVLWHPPGVEERVSDTGGVPREWHIVEHSSPNEVVVVHPRGALHSVHVAWQRGSLMCWYVNFEDPWERSRVGYDTRDLFLDIWVEPDRSWRFLDEDELEAAEQEGAVGADEAARVRAEGARVAERIEHWQSPFDEGWEDWRPDLSWEMPQLPEGWDVV